MGSGTVRKVDKLLFSEVRILRDLNGTRAFLRGIASILLAVFLCICILPASPASAAGAVDAASAKGALLERLDADHYPSGSYRTGEVVVVLEQPTLECMGRLYAEFSGILADNVREVLSAFVEHPQRIAVRLRLDPGLDELEASRLLVSSPLVKLAEPNIVFQATATNPNDPFYNQQWNLKGAYGVEADLAWDLQRGSSGLTLAVIDTGMDYNHEDLIGRRTDGWDYYNGDSNPFDDNGHGTVVAGVACANTNNSIGVAGLDWYARVMPLKALGANGEGYLDSVVNSLYHAANNGADVINMSFTSSSYSQELVDAVEFAHSKGCVMVAAAGNEGDTRLNYPAALTYVIGAASTDLSGNHSYFSNHNSSVDLAAPGEAILGPNLGNTYRLESGTSEATPHISAAALLVLAEYPGSTTDEVWRRLKDGARDLGGPGYDEEYGWGLLDINGALRAPLVTITSPQDMSYPMSGKVSANATSANANIGYMELWIDGALVESYTATPSGSVSHTFNSWDLSQLAEGTHTITVRAIDTGGSWEGEQALTVYRNLSQPRPDQDWYLAEGTTAWGFEEYVLVQNPNAAPASVQATFMKPGGSTQEYAFSMAGYSRLTLPVNNLVASSDVSTHIHADVPVVAERAMYWGGKDGGHDTLGVTDGCTTWILAEGSTAWGFEEYILVQNPTQYTASVTFNFMKPGGGQVRVVYSVGPLSRFTLNVADIVPGSDVSAFVEADQPVIVERSMYWPHGSRSRAGGHCSTGSITAAGNWYLAEGSTAWGFDEYILLANPTDEIAHATLVFMRTDGSTMSHAVEIAGRARYTVYANEVDPNRDASVQVVSNLPLVVERAMYWSDKEGGTDALGVLQP
jgi:subtilisin family serine protease